MCVMCRGIPQLKEGWGNGAELMSSYFNGCKSVLA